MNENMYAAITGIPIQEVPGLPDVTDFEAVRDLICFRPVNGERSREKLKSMPHRDFLDLAIVYYIPVTAAGGTGRIAVTNRLSGMWKVDEGALYRHAAENTGRMLTVELRPVEEVLWEMLSEENGGIRWDEQTGGASGLPMYVLRCGKRGQATAAALLYESVLREFAGQHGDFYILPSSVFEVILVPVGSFSNSPAYYRSMVGEVNRTQLLPDEVLSDNAYYYHAGTGEIEIPS